VTHGISHLHKCDDIFVVSQGEIVDQGPYKDLMNRSKILRELVHSITTSNKEQYQRQMSSQGKCDKNVFNEHKADLLDLF
jgi:ABC-type methionine transport system ATPase subunit